MSFVVINDEFICEWCQEINPPSHGTCRNHCKNCLSSKHVDHKFPGDRKSLCNGKLVAINAIPHSKHEIVIIHECEKCKKSIQNKKSHDDNFEQILALMKYNAENQII
jgi:hypothetical protein